MAEGGGSNPGSGSRPMSSFESAGGRLRFTVELRPGETTIVSWKKLLREATSSKASGSGPSASCPSLEANQQPGSKPPLPPPAVASSKQPEENEAKDPQAQAGTNRLSTVIEKIERMYAGHESSEEEDVPLDDVPDDDEYDTEDSFIDDTELDDYFQVDNSAIKHDGFFVNRGKLERIEPTISANQQPKKRRRKDVAKGQGGMDDGQNPNKHVKIGNKGRKALSSIERNSTNQSHIVALPNVHRSDLLFEASPTDAAEVSLKKKTVDTQITMDPLGLSNVDGSRQDKDADQQRTRVLSSQNHNNHRKESSELQNTLAQRPNDKSSHASKSHSGKQLSNADGLDQTIQRKEKGGHVERFDLNVPASRDSQIAKVPLMPRKEGSHFRQKIAMLDKAIRELEKIVAESRPPSTEVQDPDNSSQAVKRRLPPEIKQKLAKVARLAQTSYGKIPKDVISRLMSILGHLMQLRTLKRNLKVMANLGLSAKQEKDDRLQKIKQEIAEMVKQRIPHINSKVEQQTTNSDDFQEAGPQGKEALKHKYSMDDVLENKICDLYDLYVEKLEEDSGPPVRRLYEELAALWPSGVMDTDGIKRAIYKAKDRRRALSGRRKDQEKMKKKKVLASKAENTIRGEAVNVNPALPVHDKLLAGPCDQGPPLTSKPVLSAAVTPAARFPVPFANAPNVDKPKQERVRGSSSSNPVDAVPTDVVPKKKVKRKPNSETVEAQFRLDKLEVSQVEERQRHHKHMAVPLPKSDLQPAAPSVSENLS
ncbi:Ubinuclein-1 [Sesamum alatum]|uniref:Ubinuclein-1 n=1 Tax=Sesamum alatum TaxID=300844 RepID=A0AAE1YG95_9LAMI|nr:Ubinuclein-1 [Sesamum alatum]